MVDEAVFHSFDAGTSQAESEAVTGHGESGARGVLREAILKVMEEIEHHEREAKHHIEQAAELRKALRESVSFLHGEGEKKPPIAIPRAIRSEKAARQAPDTNDKSGVDASKHRKPKKK